MTGPETHVDGRRSGPPGSRAAGDGIAGDPRFRAALETMLDSVVIATAVRDDDGRIVDFDVDYINPAAEVGQRPAEQIVGRRFLDVWPSITESPIWKMYLHMVETAEPIVLDNFVYSDVIDGRAVSAAFDIRATRLGDGFLQNFRDVTERYGLQEDLVASEKRFRSALDAMVDPFFTFAPVRDDQGQIVELEYRYINQAAERLLQMPRQDVVGHGLLELFPSIREFGVWDAYVESIQTGTSGRIDLPYFDEHGVTGSFDLAVTPGDVELIVDAREVSEARRAEETMTSQAAQLRRNAAELEDRIRQRTADLLRSNQELEGFSYSVAHDLRAPLRAIHGYCQILLDDHAEQLDEDGRVLLGSVGRYAVRMGQLIEDLLALARVGRGDHKYVRIDMNALAGSVVADLRAGYAGSWPAVAVGPLADAPGDPALIRLVWENLIGNAVKFSADRADARVRVESEATAGEVIYHVRDNGIGFDMAYAGKLFGAFQRLHPADFPGTGIGLAITARIVERHGGRVWADSRPGDGACFSFALPASTEKGETP